jgi:hypothetical protein
MTAIDLDEDRLNLEVRKFLKQVGVTSQREIEKAVRDAAASGDLAGAAPLNAKMTLTIPALGLEHVVEHVFSVGQGEG